jgi:hypothetical protein
MRVHNHHPFVLSLSKDRPFFPRPEREGQGFDRLSQNGSGDGRRLAYLP